MTVFASDPARGKFIRVTRVASSQAYNERLREMLR
jgi:Fe2+ transport system protein FeoA